MQTRFCVSLCVTYLLVTTSDAFIIKTLNVGGGGAPMPNALLEGIQGAVAGKLDTVSALAGRIVELKQNVAVGLLDAVGGKVMAIQGALAPVLGAVGDKVTTLQNAVGGLVQTKVSAVQGLLAAKMPPPPPPSGPKPKPIATTPPPPPPPVAEPAPVPEPELELEPEVPATVEPVVLEIVKSIVVNLPVNTAPAARA